MSNQWGELRSLIHAGHWFEVSQFFWQTDTPQRELMRKYILDHMDRRKSHVIIEMFNKVFKSVRFGHIPFDRIFDEFHNEPIDGLGFDVLPETIALIMESVDGSLFILAIDSTAYDQCFDITEYVDICGDLTDLEDAPILRADVLKSDFEHGTNPMKGSASQKWTFYHFATHKGYVTIRWMDVACGRELFYSRDAKVFVFESNLYEHYDNKYLNRLF